MEWISIKEQLPKVDELVRTKNEKGIIGSCRYKSGGGWYLQISPMFGGLLHPDSYPTHWMPLPDLPQ